MRAIHKRAILMSLLSMGLLTITNIYQTLSVRFLMESVSQAILAKNSSEYMWLGNRYIPPVGVPTFVPEDYVSVFKDRNILFMGDSTMRRSYGTLFEIMNSSDFSNVHAEDIDAVDVLDFNKYSLEYRREGCVNQERGIIAAIENVTSNYPFPIYVCRDVPIEQNSSIRMSNGLHNNIDIILPSNQSTRVAKEIATTSAESKGKFDFFWSPCFADAITLFSNKRAIDAIKDYDILVVSTGIWDVLYGSTCKISGYETKTIEERVDEFVKALLVLDSLNVKVYFRTLGFTDEGKLSDVMQHISNHMKEVHNFTIVDWGGVIQARSYGEERIKGDLNTHYGLEARLLFAQQLLHEILASEIRNTHLRSST